MKSKKTLIIVIGLILAAIAAGLIWNNQHKSTDHSNMDMSNDATQSTTPSADSGSTTTANVVKITMEAGNFYFSPKTITAKKGDTIEVTLTGKGMMHDFTLDEFNVSSGMVEPGKTVTFKFTADKSGTFEYYCSIGSHRQRGQVGTLTVE